jgi:hypothetical protein
LPADPPCHRLALSISRDTPRCLHFFDVGSSLSLGGATVENLAQSSILLRGVNTAGNQVQTKDTAEAAESPRDEGVTGAVVIKDDRLAACGKLKLVPFLSSQ